MSENEEPGWLTRLRPAAKQRPRTTYAPRIKWHDLQELLRERDVLWQAASEETRARIEALRREYGHA